MRSRSVTPHFAARARSSSLRNSSRPWNWPPTQDERGRRQHALGRAARAHVHIDRGVGIGDRDHARDVAVGDQVDAAADAAQLCDQLLVARAVEHHDDDLVRIDALGLGQRLDIGGRGLVERDQARS